MIYSRLRFNIDICYKHCKSIYNSLWCWILIVVYFIIISGTRVDPLLFCIRKIKILLGDIQKRKCHKEFYASEVSNRANHGALKRTVCPCKISCLLSSKPTLSHTSPPLDSSIKEGAGTFVSCFCAISNYGLMYVGLSQRCGTITRQKQYWTVLNKCNLPPIYPLWHDMRDGDFWLSIFFVFLAFSVR